MATLNRATLIGRLTADPSPPRQLNGGGQVVSFRMAVGRSRRGQSGEYEPDPFTLYIDCECFARPDDKRNLPEIVTSYARKGSEVYAEGRLQLDEWTDKATNQKRSKIKLVLSDLQLVGDRADRGERAESPRREATPAVADDGDGGDDEKIPF